MTFYVYENWRADDKAVVHRADCKFCNNGKGTGRCISGNVNGKWHGSFMREEDALRFANGLRRRTVRCCGICLNGQNMKKDNYGNEVL